MYFADSHSELFQVVIKDLEFLVPVMI